MNKNMKFAISVFLLAVCALNVVHCATIQDCVTRIANTQQYLSSEVSKLRSTITQSITDTKANLNRRGEEIKSEIRKGPQNCQVWISQIDSILKSSVNFMYAFSPCEKTSDINALERTKNDLNALNKNAEKLNVLCTITNCQGSIDSLYNSVGVIERNIGTKSTDILSASKRCVEERTNSPSRLMESAYGSWKKCS